LTTAAATAAARMTRCATFKIFRLKFGNDMFPNFARLESLQLSLNKIDFFAEVKETTAKDLNKIPEICFLTV